MIPITITIYYYYSNTVTIITIETIISFYWIYRSIGSNIFYWIYTPGLLSQKALRQLDSEQFLSIYRVPLLFLLELHNSPINIFIIVINL